MNSISTYFPIINLLKSYKSNDFKSDGFAGFAVGVVLIPQGMAYSVIAGLPPIYGLYAGLVPLFVYPLFASSKHLSVGPVAIDMLILSAGLGIVSGADMNEKITLAILIATLTGIFQIVMGLIKLGFIFNLFSRPVVSGFTSAAPIIIIFSQFGTLTGIELQNSNYIFEIGSELISKIQFIHWPTFTLSLILIGALYLIRILSRKGSEAVIIVVLALITGYFFDFTSFGIQQIDQIPDGLPMPAFDIPTLKTIKSVLPTVFTLSLIQFMTVASLTKSFARKHNYAINPDNELIAIGSSNLLGSIFSSIPISGSFSRSAIAEQSGTSSVLSNMFAGIVILMALLFLTPVFEILPIPVLGAIIVVSVAGLIDLKELYFLFNTKRRDAIVALITFMSVLIIGIQEGIIIGIVSSMIAILIKLSKPTVAELGVLPNSKVFKNINRFDKAETVKGILILRIDASFSFVNAQFFKNYILDKSFSRLDKPKFVIIDGSTIGDLDVSAIDALIMIIETLNEKGIELYISGLIGPVRDVIHNSDIKTFFKSDRFFNNVHQAVKIAQDNINNSDQAN